MANIQLLRELSVCVCVCVYVFSLSPYNAGTFTVSSKHHINAASITNRPELNSLQESGLQR